METSVNEPSRKRNLHATHSFENSNRVMYSVGYLSLQGITSPEDIARALNRAGITRADGGPWIPSAMAALMTRINIPRKNIKTSELIPGIHFTDTQTWNYLKPWCRKNQWSEETPQGLLTLDPVGLTASQETLKSRQKKAGVSVATSVWNPPIPIPLAAPVTTQRLEPVETTNVARALQDSTSTLTSKQKAHRLIKAMEGISETVKDSMIDALLQ